MRATYIGLFGLLMIIFASCGNPKELRYFQGNFDTAKLSQIVFKEPIIQKGDILSIRVFSDNAAATEPYNMVSANAAATSQAGNSMTGYEVDQNGYIQMAGLGNMKVMDLTLNQLDSVLDEKFKLLLSHPYYNIRFLNFKITVLGDVKTPGTYNFPVQKVSIMDLLGMSGDLTMYGKRTNILVVREQNGKREFGRMNLLTPDIFNSPWYYLQQNDVVYVDMLDKKAIATDQTMRWLGITTTLISTAALIIALLK